jgi:hypothetical protein
MIPKKGVFPNSLFAKNVKILCLGIEVGFAKISIYD